VVGRGVLDGQPPFVQYHDPQAIVFLVFVFDHENIEEDTTFTIRARIINYNELVSSSSSSTPLSSSKVVDEGSTILSSKTIYDIGPTKVSLTTCQPLSSFVWTSNPRTTSQKQAVDCFHILEGSMVLDQKLLSVGDTIVLPIGWTSTGSGTGTGGSGSGGHCSINNETVKLLRIQA